MQSWKPEQRSALVPALDRCSEFELHPCREIRMRYQASVRARGTYGVGPRVAVSYLMATYEISSALDRGFDVKVVGDDGARQTVLGFPTWEIAEAWIHEDQRRSHGEGQSRFRTPAPI